MIPNLLLLLLARLGFGGRGLFIILSLDLFARFEISYLKIVIRKVKGKAGFFIKRIDSDFTPKIEDLTSTIIPSEKKPLWLTKLYKQIPIPVRKYNQLFIVKSMSFQIVLNSGIWKVRLFFRNSFQKVVSCFLTGYDLLSRLCRRAPRICAHRPLWASKFCASLTSKFCSLLVYSSNLFFHGR